jgi:RNA polymerase sigma-70 factor (ECF subfamily)
VSIAVELAINRWEERIAAERPRLVGLCQRITGDIGSAEDLTQETLAEAWRLRDRLSDEQGFDRWLSAIARNLCRRWMRAQGREAAESGHDLPDIAGDWDLEVELERSELASLLDRALGLLPPHTRAELVARYVENLPLSEIAERLGQGQGAVAMRIQRGKLALRKLLTTELRHEAVAFGLLDGTAAWQETRIWCPFCGLARLRGSFIPGIHLRLRCPHCCAVHPPGFNVCCIDERNSSREELRALLGNLKTFRPALNRVLDSTAEHYGSHLASGALPCRRCGRPSPLRFEAPEPVTHPPSLMDEPQLHARCPECGAISHEALKHLALQVPEVRAFWRAHPRMRVLPYRMVERDGAGTWLTAFESLTDGSRIDVGANPRTLEPAALAR